MAKLKAFLHPCVSDGQARLAQAPVGVFLGPEPCRPRHLLFLVPPWHRCYPPFAQAIAGHQAGVSPFDSFADPMAISIITVIYKSVGVLPGYLKGLGGHYRLIIIDNGPDDGGRDLARKAGAEVIVPEENLGFGRGCNLGASRSNDDFLLFLNPDSQVGPEEIEALHRAALRHPEASAFGPLLRGETGDIQFKRESLLTPEEPLLPAEIGTDDRPVRTISGAAMVIRRSAFEKIGGFDPEIFMYYEDDDICLRLAASCGPVLLVPSVRFTHLLSRSSAPSAALTRFKSYHWTRSRIHVLRKYGFRRPWLRGLRNAFHALEGPGALRDPTQWHEFLGRLTGALSLIGRR